MKPYDVPPKKSSCDRCNAATTPIAPFETRPFRLGADKVVVTSKQTTGGIGRERPGRLHAGEQPGAEPINCSCLVRPALLFFHGVGYIFGHIDLFDGPVSR